MTEATRGDETMKMTADGKRIVTPARMHRAIKEGHAWIVEDDGFTLLIVATRKGVYHFSPMDQLYIEI